MHTIYKERGMVDVKEQQLLDQVVYGLRIE